MTTYIVTYEISKAERKNALIAKLKEEPFYCPIHESACAIRTEKDITELKLELVKITTSVDRLFVIKTGHEAVWINAYSMKNSEWLKKYL
jgi:hypothetical protein